MIDKVHKKTSKRYTLGLFDVYGPAEYSSQLAQGVFDAAKAYDFNVIRFANHDAVIAMKAILHPNAILEHIHQYNLDGLIFVGWIQEHKTFIEKLDIPLISIGTGFPNVPCVYFPGDEYLEELLRHFIIKHGHTKIAYIAPYWSDSRNDRYIHIMKEYGIYNEALYVGNELGQMELELRAKRALEILLDQRRVIPQVILSMYSREAVALLGELKKRGLKVPSDIALACYEDCEAGAHALPSITSIYFPWTELGFAAVKGMYAFFKGEDIPSGTRVDGRIYFRRSCGCFPEALKISERLPLEKDVFDKKEITDNIKRMFVDLPLDFDRIFDKFSKDYYYKTKDCFVSELEEQLQTLSEKYIEDMTDVLFYLRTQMIPFLSDKYHVENLFQQAYVLLNEIKFNIKVSQKLQAEPLNLHLQEISQALSVDFSIENMSRTLCENLPKLDIPSCYIILANSEEQMETGCFNDCTLVFQYSDHVWKESFENKSAKRILQEKLFPKDRIYLLNTYLLHVTKAFIGFAIFESGTCNGWIFQSLSIHLSNALWGWMLLEKLEQSYRKLVAQAHREGMADIATGILHNVGNILNSINVSIEAMDKILSSLPVDEMNKANGLLEENFDNILSFIENNPKGKKLLKFYLMLGQPFHEGKMQLRYYLDRLGKKVNSVNEIISAQQNYAGVKATLEECDLVSILEDVLIVLANVLENENIHIVKKYKNKPRVMVQRIKVFHVLVNIINNAKDAMKRTPKDQRVLILSIFENNNGKYLKIRDSGCGISKESIVSIFAYGFTTKRNGHGFGLHSSANYMTEMGGKLWAKSEGDGQGATFVLQFQ